MTRVRVLQGVHQSGSSVIHALRGAPLRQDHYATTLCGRGVTNGNGWCWCQQHWPGEVMIAGGDEPPYPCSKCVPIAKVGEVLAPRNRRTTGSGGLGTHSQKAGSAS